MACISSLFWWLLLSMAAGTIQRKAEDASQERAQEQALLKAAETAEPHCIAVGCALLSHFDLAGNDKRWPSVYQTIITGKGPVERVREFMPDRLRKLTAADHLLEKMAANAPRLPLEAVVFMGEFKQGFNKILARPDFFTKESFAGVKLSPEVKRLIAVGDRRTAWQTACLNWQLISAVFGDAIPPLPPDFRTIRVEVRGNKEVVLVLSCCSECRWEVAVKPGAKVTGVVLCGTGPHEVELNNNPLDATIIYRAGFNKYGQRRLPDHEWFDGFELLGGPPERKLETRKKFELGMKKLLGKDFASIQRRNYTARKEGYVIDASAKK